jgi:Flp pilus assembly protein TadG
MIDVIKWISPFAKPFQAKLAMVMVKPAATGVRRRSAAGQSLTEFAVSMTFLLILLSGILDLGRAYFVILSLRDAAQEGASYASIDPTDLTAIRQRVRQSSQGPIDFTAFADSQITIQYIGPACAGNGVQVTLEYSFEFIAPFIGGTALPLTADFTDTILQPAC